jgi:hypothetical protein
VPSVAFPAPSTAGPILADASIAPTASYTGYAPPTNAVTATISGIAADAAVTYRMAWLTFTVTLANSSDFAFKDVEPYVVMGRCGCDPRNGDSPPVLLEHQNASGAWVNLSAGVMNGKGRFDFGNQVGELDLAGHAVVRLTYRIRIGNTANNTANANAFTNGVGSLGVYVLQLPEHSRLTTDLGPDASTPLSFTLK